MHAKVVYRTICWMLLLLVALAACQPRVVVPEDAEPWYVEHLAITQDSVELCNEAGSRVTQCKESVTTKLNSLRGLILPSVPYPPVEYRAFDIKQEVDSCTQIAYAAFDGASVVVFPELFVILCGPPSSTYTCWREEGSNTPRGKIIRTHCCADNSCVLNLTVSTTDTEIIGWDLLNTTLHTLGDEWNFRFE